MTTCDIYGARQPPPVSVPRHRQGGKWPGKDGPSKSIRPPLLLSRMLRWHTTHNREADTMKLAGCQRRLEELRWERVPFGMRLRKLRHALGWTQSMAAMMLGISTRTVIRHEKGQHRRRAVLTPMLLKLRALEAKWACTLVEHLIGVKHIHPWHPSEQNRMEK